MLRLFAALLCAALLVPTQAQAQGQTWPNRAIELIVPQGPGSGTDLIARLIADGVSQRLGQPMVVENLPAASGLLAHQTAARAAPDGATFLFSTVSGLAINPVTVKVAPLRSGAFHAGRHGGRFRAADAVGERPSCRSNRCRDFIAYAKANPGKLSYALDITVTAAVVFGAAARNRPASTWSRYPSRSPAQIAATSAAGVSQATVSSLAAFGAMIQAGNRRPLGWFGGKRFSYQPDVPTVAETVLG